MQQDETTAQILTSLRNDMMLEAQDAANAGDRASSAVLTRIVKALTRNIERREQHENAAEPVVDSEPLQSMEQAAAEAAGKRAN